MKTINSCPWIEPLIAAVLASGLSALILREGVILSPDGWAYWEGSVSLLYGRGYHYFGGERIFYYPPLFSAYLALWQGLFGIRGSTLCLALVVTCGVSAFLWTRLFRLLFGEHKTWFHSLLLVVFVPSFLAACNALLLSEVLQLPLQALLLLAIIQAMLRKQPPKPWQYWGLNLWLGLLYFLMLACRNSSLAFLPAIGLFVFLFTRKYVQNLAGFSQKVSFALNLVASSALVLLVPIGAWHYLRSVLHQLGSHGLQGPEQGMVSVLYVGQIGESLLFFLGPNFLGLVLLLGLIIFLVFGLRLLRHPQAHLQIQAIQLLLFFVVSGVLSLFVIFNLTYIADPLMGRYLWFVPLMLIGSGLALATQIPRWGKWVSGFFIVLVGLQVIRVAFFVTFTLEPFDAMPRTRVDFGSEAFTVLCNAIRMGEIPEVEYMEVADRFYNLYALMPAWPGRLVPHNWTLSPDWFDVEGCFPGRIQEVEGAMLMSPPNYPWFDREFHSKRKQTVSFP